MERTFSYVKGRVMVDFATRRVRTAETTSGGTQGLEAVSDHCGLYVVESFGHLVGRHVVLIDSGVMQWPLAESNSRRDLTVVGFGGGSGWLLCTTSVGDGGAPSRVVRERWPYEHLGGGAPTLLGRLCQDRLSEHTFSYVKACARVSARWLADHVLSGSLVGFSCSS